MKSIVYCTFDSCGEKLKSDLVIESLIWIIEENLKKGPLEFLSGTF